MLELEKQLALIRLEQKEGVRKYSESEEAKHSVSVCVGDC